MSSTLRGYERHKTDFYVHHQRMSFTDDGGTDSIEYAHFVWKKGTSSNDSKLFLI